MTRLIFFAGALTGLAIGTWMVQLVPQRQRADLRPPRPNLQNARAAEYAEA